MNHQNGLPVIQLSGFVSRFTAVLPRLLAALVSEELRQHPVWGTALPYDVERYGKGRSLGHCIRPDVILTEDGPRICEIDFVPSGRGYTLSSVPDRERIEAYLDTFARWYSAMGVSHVAYATATVTTCWEETQTFSSALREHSGIDIHAVNIDETPINGALIDRLFYRSEMSHPELALGKEVMTKEPHIDSKVVAALVHELTAEELLLRFMSPHDLAFLREAFPETYRLQYLREMETSRLEGMVSNRKVDGKVVMARNEWVIKNGDVESTECWGSRGVIIGRKYREQKFKDAVLLGKNPANKHMGNRPVLQRFAESIDFAPIWNALVSGELSTSSRMGKDVDPCTQQPATKHVFARVGFYCLVANTTDEIFVPPVGVLTLRQDELAHGSRDVNYTAFEIQ